MTSLRARLFDALAGLDVCKGGLLGDRSGESIWIMIRRCRRDDVLDGLESNEKSCKKSMQHGQVV
jgi:hypothetical protein